MHPPLEACHLSEKNAIMLHAGAHDLQPPCSSHPSFPAGGTRTCIHTPSEPFHPSEMDAATCTAVLDGASLVYFDGRLTEAAVLLARAARSAGVPVLVEAERLRPSLEQLLAEADFVCTSAHFPQVCWKDLKSVLSCEQSNQLAALCTGGL